MILGVIENGEVRIYGNIDDVMLEWGAFPTDLASDVIILFDEDGTWLKPIEHYAPRSWYRWYRKLNSVELKRASKEENYQDPLGYLLQYEATSISPNAFVKTLEELRKLYPYKGHHS